MMKQALTLVSIAISAQSSTAGLCGCSTQFSCNDLFDESWNQVFTITNVSAPWSNLVSLDNTLGTDPKVYNVSYDIGFSASSSISVDGDWKPSASQQLASLAHQAGDAAIISSVNSETWGPSLSKWFDITVPSGEAVSVWQREIRFDMSASTQKTCQQVAAGISNCMQVSQNTITYSAIIQGCEALCKVCEFPIPATYQELAFYTPCYSSNPDESERDKLCPIPNIGGNFNSLMSKRLRGDEAKREVLKKKISNYRAILTGNEIDLVDKSGKVTFVLQTAK